MTKSLSKSKPYRSKEFMKSIHERRDLVGETCATCHQTWSQLHHFGTDGGMSMKPSDLYVVKLCKTCADLYEVKARALIRDERWDLLSEFLLDSMVNVQSWIKWKEDKRNRASLRDDKNTE